MVRSVKIHPAKHNPDTWRWRLVLWLTGGEIEAVPLLPLRPIHSTETVVLRLGKELALNTVEVKSMIHETNDLLPIESVKRELAPNTFVLLELDMGIDREPAETYQYVVCTFINWTTLDGEDALVVEQVEGPPPRQVTIAISAVVRAWWAPMGYRL